MRFAETKVLKLSYQNLVTNEPKSKPTVNPSNKYNNYLTEISIEPPVHDPHQRNIKSPTTI